MKVTDYIVEFLKQKEVTDVFGYPGGVICHFMDSLNKQSEVVGHINYHEQASAFAACSYAQATGKLGVAYATSGPGATNLITGIANAWFDSIPVLFITGQVDTYGLKGTYSVRQRGFQETDIVSLTQSICKCSIRVDSAEDIPYYLEKVYTIATTGRPGPVVLDLPADVQRANIDVEAVRHYENVKNCMAASDLSVIAELLKNSKRPIIIAGAAVKQSKKVAKLRAIIREKQIPVVMSMPAFDILPFSDSMNMGFIGVNGKRYANIAVQKSDLIIAIGTRLDLKQVGGLRKEFALGANLIRVDIDKNELEYCVRENEIQIHADLSEVLDYISECQIESNQDWVDICAKIRNELSEYDMEEPHKLIAMISEKIPDAYGITLDVGQNQPWVAQAFKVKEEQMAFMSAGLGSMGYSLPAAIGAYYGLRKPIVSFNGDGGIQMNIQELQFIKREHIPVKVIILNNASLGMIRQFQEKNFDKQYYQTIEGTGYSAPDFGMLAKGYGLSYYKIKNEEDVAKVDWESDEPCVIEVVLPNETLLNPNQVGGKPVYVQSPLLDEKIMRNILDL